MQWIEEEAEDRVGEKAEEKAEEKEAVPTSMRSSRGETAGKKRLAGMQEMQGIGERVKETAKQKN